MPDGSARPRSELSYLALTLWSKYRAFEAPGQLPSVHFVGYPVWRLEKLSWNITGVLFVGEIIIMTKTCKLQTTAHIFYLHTSVKTFVFGVFTV